MTFERFQERLFQIGLLALIFLSGFLWTSAEESDTEAPAESFTAEDYACAQAVVAGGEELMEAYFVFLDQYFKIDTPSSEQLADTMTFYRFVEDSIYNLYTQNAQLSGSDKTLGFAGQELAVCRQKRDEYLLVAQTALYKQVMGSATYKTTFQFVDGLKIMNENLAALSTVFQETFPGQFIQMDNGLQCYASQCITQ